MSKNAKNAVTNAVRIPADLLVPRVNHIDGIDRPILAVLDHPRDMARNLGIGEEEARQSSGTMGGIPAQLTLSHCRVCDAGGLCVTGDLLPVTDTRCVYFLCRKCHRIYRHSGLKPFEYLMKFLAEQDAEEIWINNRRAEIECTLAKCACASECREERGQAEEDEEEEAPMNAPDSPGVKAWETFTVRLAILAVCLVPCWIADVVMLVGALRVAVVSLLFVAGLVGACFACLIVGRPLEVAPNE